MNAKEASCGRLHLNFRSLLDLSGFGGRGCGRWMINEGREVSSPPV